MRRLGALFVLAGCDVVFRIDHLKPLDAAVITDAHGHDASPDAILVCAPRYITPGDYDHDGIPNELDNCPAHADPPNAGPDTDGDGVGDACDPNPNTPGDCILLFDGFEAPPTTCWSSSGTWTFGCAADGRGLCSPPAGTDGTLDLASSEDISFVHLDAHLLDALGGNADAVQVFLNFDDASGISGVTCQIEEPAQFFGAGGFIYTNGIRGSGGSNQAAPTVLYQSASITLDWLPSAVANTTTCKFTATTPTQQTMGIVSTFDQHGRLAVHTINSHVRIDSVTGFGRGNACP